VDSWLATLDVPIETFMAEDSWLDDQLPESTIANTKSLMNEKDIKLLAPHPTSSSLPRKRVAPCTSQVESPVGGVNEHGGGERVIIRRKLVAGLSTSWHSNPDLKGLESESQKDEDAKECKLSRPQSFSAFDVADSCLF
jgi:hypothetical protein